MSVTKIDFTFSQADSLLAIQTDAATVVISNGSSGYQIIKFRFVRDGLRGLVKVLVHSFKPEIAYTSYKVWYLSAWRRDKYHYLSKKWINIINNSTHYLSTKWKKKNIITTQSFPTPYAVTTLTTILSQLFMDKPTSSTSTRSPSATASACTSPSNHISPYMQPQANLLVYTTHPKSLWTTSVFSWVLKRHKLLLPQYLLASGTSILLFGRRDRMLVLLPWSQVQGLRTSERLNRRQKCGLLFCMGLK